MSKAAVLLADGFEDIEAISIIDVLRRAGVDVLITRVGDGEIATSAHGVKIGTDVAIADLAADELDAVVLPGGLPGAHNLRDSDEVKSLVSAHAEKGNLTAAICAAPIALAAAGVISGKRVTCYPSFEDQLGDAVHVEERVVEDGNLITGAGPGPALEFALALAARLSSEEMASQLRAGMLI